MPWLRRLTGIGSVFWQPLVRPTVAQLRPVPWGIETPQYEKANPGSNTDELFVWAKVVCAYRVRLGFTSRCADPNME